MEAKLDASDQTLHVETNEHFRAFEWVRQSEIVADRKLQCTVTSMQTGNVTKWLKFRHSLFRNSCNFCRNAIVQFGAIILDLKNSKNDTKVFASESFIFYF